MKIKSKFPLRVGLQFFAARSKTMMDMKRDLQMLGEEVVNASEALRSKLTDATITSEELADLKRAKSFAQERFDAAEAEYKEMEQEQRSRLQRQEPILAAENNEERMIAAKAEYYRSILTGQAVSEETRNLLGTKQTTSTGGEKFLPTTLSNQIVSEPKQKNPLRPKMTLTNIKGLERPKISFELDDDDFVTDEETAKELEVTGDKVSFGRHKVKVKARISDSVIHGSDLDLVTEVESALQAALAVKEKRLTFAESPKKGTEHMSLYEPGKIKSVTGGNMIEAIINALGDLGDDYQENVSVTMRRQDYYASLKELANGSTDLYKLQPEEVIGAPVTFCELAKSPVIGDFTFLHGNYDGGVIYDADKDVDKGEYIFVLTAWYDQHKVLSSAFRITEVKPTP
ncbi:phage major capsid protein [Bacillus paranthracis]|uniref:phage major capsid protein n=1 Tax=Bacillus paranthracis TaxID=2026186 RepID=UPI003D21AAF4